ncbi:protein SAWADEE HOMEODOMAIN HOMOLOG 2-like isoform X1 [Rhododendron vialii]|uniref:protein SAWADEE HOMEODOMAIN HOMOLOG 2-like isoform X1 n=1 Tax=Rhododendron vialii TaxID=182163 RepID=UPI00265FEFFB|nr:protein SAWADEE HOMEODOMAIN HOMOLOG 2-like isoform X1 [Rhododendron vialii]
MGRPPSNGNPTFRFNQTEVAEMESILQEHNAQMPTRELLEALAEKFRHSAERSGKILVQMKQVWNWFQNRRYAIRAKTAKAPGKLSISPMPREDSSVVRNVSQAPQSATVPSAVQSAGRTVSDNSQMEFEAKSARDGAWYDVAMFISHRSLETGEPDVKVRFAGFGPEEDEWVNVRKHVRQRSLPCESSECVAVLPGDLILCFQEGKEQALYFDAHVLDAQRRRHDVRGCRCRFLVRYDHDQSEEIVPLRKVCRRPETDYRLQQLHAVNDSGSVNQQKKTSGPHTANSLRVYPPTETTQKQPKVEVVAPAPQANATVSAETKVLPPKSSEISTAGNVGTPIAPPPNVALTSGAATSTITSDSGQNTPQG